MRITCPNCSAQYEIDAALLPDDGREVQCSACGHVWFQEGPNAHRSRTFGAEVPGAMRDDMDGETDAPRAPVPPRRAPARPAQVEAEPEPDPQDADARSPRQVDNKVLGILREEAEFEAQARAREAGQLETQPELGLQGSAPWPTNSRAPDADATPAPGARDSRGGADGSFPDIEDISSTLEPIGTSRKASGQSVDLPATAQERSRSFIRGLVIPLALGLIVIALYVAAPALVSALPVLEPVLTAFVSAIDGLRVRLAELLGR